MAIQNISAQFNGSGKLAPKLANFAVALMALAGVGSWSLVAFETYFNLPWAGAGSLSLSFVPSIYHTLVMQSGPSPPRLVGAGGWIESDVQIDQTGVLWAGAGNLNYFVFDLPAVVPTPTTDLLLIGTANNQFLVLLGQYLEMQTLIYPAFAGVGSLSVNVFDVQAAPPGFVTAVANSINNPASVTSQALVYSGNVIHGACLVTAARWGAAETSFTISDTVNGLWPAANVKWFSSPTIGMSLVVGVFPNTLSGLPTVTITAASTAGNVRMAVAEYGNILPTPAFDIAPTFQQLATATTAPATPSVPTAHANDILLAIGAANNAGYSWIDNAVGSNPASGWINRFNIGPNGKFWWSDNTVGATATYNETWTTPSDTFITSFTALEQPTIILQLVTSIIDPPLYANFNGVGGWIESDVQFNAAWLFFNGVGGWIESDVQVDQIAAQWNGTGGWQLVIQQQLLNINWAGVGSMTANAQDELAIGSTWNGVGSLTFGSYSLGATTASFNGVGNFFFVPLPSIYHVMSTEFDGVGSLTINVRQPYQFSYARWTGVGGWLAAPYQADLVGASWSGTGNLQINAIESQGRFLRPILWTGVGSLTVFMGAIVHLSTSPPNFVLIDPVWNRSYSAGVTVGEATTMLVNVGAKVNNPSLLITRPDGSTYQALPRLVLTSAETFPAELFFGFTPFASFQAFNYIVYVFVDGELAEAGTYTVTVQTPTTHVTGQFMVQHL